MPTDQSEADGAEIPCQRAGSSLVGLYAFSQEGGRGAGRKGS